MKCPYCGAEVNTTIMKCEYCGSKIEPKVTRPFRRAPINNEKPRRSPIAKFIIIFAIIMVAGNIFILGLFKLITNIVYDSHDTKTTQIITQDISDEKEEEERLVDKLPKNAVDAIGKVVSCTTSGTATIEYSDKNYYDIKILDTALIEWLADKGKSIDNVGIMFSTDEDRNITEIALLTSPFYIMYQEGDTYVAFREDHVITFTSEIDLTIDSCYEGYFNYPDMNLHSGTTTDCGAYYHFGTPLCDEKMSTTEKSVPNGNEVNVYKVRVGSEWYYCSKDTYDELNIGDAMNEYTFTGRGYSYVY